MNCQESGPFWHRIFPAEEKGPESYDANLAASNLLCQDVNGKNVMSAFGANSWAAKRSAGLRRLFVMSWPGFPWPFLSRS